MRSIRTRSGLGVDGAGHDRSGILVTRRRAHIAVASAAVLAATTLITTGPTGLAAATDSCSALGSGTVRLASSEKTTYKRVYRDYSGQVTYSETETRRGPVNTGTMSLQLTTCKSDGNWRLLDVDMKQPHNDLILTVHGSKVDKVDPASGNMGYAIVHRRTGGGEVLLDALRCTQAPQKFLNGLAATAKALTSIPLPTGYLASVAVYAANVALPDAPEDKYWCGRIGPTMNIDLDFRPDGTPFLQWGQLAGKRLARTARTTFEQPCEAVPYCADIYDETVTVTKP